MASKKKLIIAIVSLCFVLTVAITSIVLVLAALNATVKSGITIKYTAYNVNATVTATYKVTGQEEVVVYTDSGNTNSTLKFNSSDKTGVEKTFQPTGSIDIGPTDYLIFHYKFTNDDNLAPMYITSFEFADNVLMNIDADCTFVSTELADPETAEYEYPDAEYITVQPGETLHGYFRFWIYNDVEDAYLDGNMIFELSSMVN